MGNGRGGRCGPLAPATGNSGLRQSLAVEQSRGWPSAPGSSTGSGLRPPTGRPDRRPAVRHAGPEERSRAARDGPSTQAGGEPVGLEAP